MSLSPICTVNGNPTLPVQSVAAGSTVTIALAVPAGAVFWDIACTSTDELNNAGTISGTLIIDPVHKTATFTAPAASGSAMIFTSTVGINNQTSIGSGRDVGGNVVPAWTTTFKVVVGPSVLAFSEVYEQNAAFGSVATVNPTLRLIASDGAGGAAIYTSQTTLGYGTNAPVPAGVKTATTVGATTATVSIPTPDNTAIRWTCSVIARNAANGTEVYSADYTVFSTVRSAGGNATQVGSAGTATGAETSGGASAASISQSVSGANVTFGLTGYAGATLHWSLTFQQQQVS